MASSSSSSSLSTSTLSNEVLLRKTQNEVFQNFLASLRTDLFTSYSESSKQYPWNLSIETIEQENQADPVPSHQQIAVLQQESQSKYNGQMQDDMTIHLSSLALFLKDTPLESKSTTQEQEEFTETVTSLLMCAAVDTFKRITGPYSPSYLVIFKHLLDLEDRGEEAQRLWLWSKMAASYLATMEVQTWVRFALAEILTNQQSILAFVGKIGNLASKRRREPELDIGDIGSLASKRTCDPHNGDTDETL